MCKCICMYVCLCFCYRRYTFDIHSLHFILSVFVSWVYLCMCVSCIYIFFIACVCARYNFKHNLKEKKKATTNRRFRDLTKWFRWDRNEKIKREPPTRWRSLYLLRYLYLNLYFISFYSYWFSIELPKC